MKKPELLAPIQDFTSLAAALNAGADAVFFGIVGFNMRANAKNFSIHDMPKIVSTAVKSNAKVYLALNTIIFDEELEDMKAILKSAKAAGVHAVICWDAAVIRYAKEIELPVHISTQASVSNTESARFYKELGANRIVLARECSLEQVREIRKNVDIELEAFVHGAMCVSISGRCFMSQFATCHSANRGECRQPCRRNYMVRDVEGEYEFEVGTNYVLSAKDLCTLPFLEELVVAGIDCFKIEGRNKSAEYVKEVTGAYREVLNFIWEHKDEKDSLECYERLATLKKKHLERLARVFTRGFSNGFYMGRPLAEWTAASGNVGTERKVYLGKVTNIYRGIGVMELAIETNETLRIGDEIYIEGKTTGIRRETVASMQMEHENVDKAAQGHSVAIRIGGDVRRNDRVSRIDTVKNK